LYDYLAKPYVAGEERKLGGFFWRLSESRIPIFIIDYKRKLNIIPNGSQHEQSAQEK
jgi:hypothetical protein